MYAPDSSIVAAAALRHSGDLYVKAAVYYRKAGGFELLCQDAQRRAVECYRAADTLAANAREPELPDLSDLPPAREGGDTLPDLPRDKENDS